MVGTFRELKRAARISGGVSPERLSVPIFQDVYKYLGLSDTEEETTESETETTETGTEEVTEDVSYATTEEIEETEETNTEAAESEAASESSTQKVTATEKGTEAKDDGDLSTGCSMSFGIGGAIVALCAIVGGATTFAKKKED